MRTNRTVWLFGICTIMVIGLWPATVQAVERGPVGAWIDLNAYDANDDLIIQEEELGAAFANLPKCMLKIWTKTRFFQKPGTDDIIYGRSPL